MLFLLPANAPMLSYVPFFCRMVDIKDPLLLTEMRWQQWVSSQMKSHVFIVYAVALVLLPLP